VRETIRKEFTKPSFVASKKLLAPPQTKRYSLVGTAFDYLLRFHVQRINKNVIERTWPATEGFNRLALRDSYDLTDADSGVSIVQTSAKHEKGRLILDRAKSARDAYLQNGRVTKSLLESAIGLAKLEVIYRSGYIDKNLEEADTADMRDLRRLLSVAPTDEFKARKVCLLNPTFRLGSDMVRGADADLVIDNSLIEIKTTKSNKSRPEHFDQLIGYLALHDIWGVDGVSNKPRISKIAVYFSRYAELCEIEVSQLIDPKAYIRFRAWFKDAVETPYQARQVRLKNFSKIRRETKNAVAKKSASKRAGRGKKVRKLNAPR
jgi:hypothetical protein